MKHEGTRRKGTDGAADWISYIERRRLELTPVLASRDGETVVFMWLVGQRVLASDRWRNITKTFALGRTPLEALQNFRARKYAASGGEPLGHIITARVEIKSR